MSRFQPKLPTDLSDALFGDVEAKHGYNSWGSKPVFSAMTDPRSWTADTCCCAETLSSLATAPSERLLDRSGRVIACVSTDDTLTPGSLTRVVSDADESRKAEDPWDVAQMSHVALRRRHRHCVSRVCGSNPDRVVIGARVSINLASPFSLRSHCSATVRSTEVSRSAAGLLTNTVVEKGHDLAERSPSAHTLVPSCTVGPMAHLRPGTVLTRRTRSATSWRPRTPPSPTAPRPHTCPTSVTHTSGREPVSAQGPSPATTTGGPNTRPSRRRRLHRVEHVARRTGHRGRASCRRGSVITTSVEDGALALTRAKQQELKHAAARIHERNRKRAQQPTTEGAQDE